MSKKKATPKGATFKQADDNTKNAVLQVLKKVKGRIPKHEIVSLVRSDERTVRDAISQLRKEGHCICNAKDGTGYWIGTRKEYEKLVVQDYNSRIVDYVQTINAFYGLPLEGQVSIDVEL